MTFAAILPDLGPHAAFIWTSYGVVAAVLIVLALGLIWDGRRQAARLADLEARRKSAP